MRLAIPVKIAIRPGQVFAAPGRDLTKQPSHEVTLPMSHDMWSCAFAHDVNLPQDAAQRGVTFQHPPHQALAGGPFQASLLRVYAIGGAL